MAKDIVQIVTKEFMKLIGKEKLEPGDIIRKYVFSKGELVIDNMDGITTLKMGIDEEKTIPVQTNYIPIKNLCEGGLFFYLDLKIPLNGLYVKVNENRWNIDVAEYFEGNATITKSKLREVGFKI